MPALSSETNYRWSRDNYSEFARTIDIWRTVLIFSWMIWIDGKKWSYIGGKTEAKAKKRTRKRAVWLRESMLQLGPTFIKVGQLLSTRADILPAESVEELSKLQDKVPAFTATKAQQIIEAELGKPLDQMFSYFEPVPLAAASLGQVHKALLPTGEEIVVKVQRPGLLKLFAIDLGILKRIAQYFQNHPKHGRGRDWVGIYEECSKILYEEADYLNEGKNADTFRRNFRGDHRIIVPRVYWRYASRRVLTLEYLPGIKVSNYAALEAAGIDRSAIARIGAEAYLEQLLNHGFFHADPHPGNLAVTGKGELIFYDFGMMGQIQSITRDKLLRTFFGIAQKDAEAVINSLVELGALEITGDSGPIRRSVQYMLDNFMGQPMEKQSVAAISDDLYDIAYDQPFRFPATFTFVLRAISTLEGLGKGLDPSFNFMEVAKPYATNLMENGSNRESGSLSTAFFGELGRQAAQVSNTAIALPRRIDDTLAKLDRGDIRVRIKSQETDRLLRRLSNVGIGAIYALLGATCLLCATLLFINGWQIPALGATIVAVIFVLTLLRLLSRIDRPER
ncbi:ABC1 kinase family protein [Pseudanabaena mucicola]|uniref:AarF/ABC1/UbiB kinase family protein n=1 Tax=Pseudanabaena mucicola FACHB-723 TaxID=2692860 RepID=A0ABR7ZSP7_9CYAN|nr:AarF/UbiB family protein [Pseudanabaena mucicola]MBD2186998.1 AarF/ABC1/UbiB kinase family protein [Pseudanabaena mucicola FACHB-723]